MLKNTYNNQCDLRRRTGLNNYRKYNNFRINFSDCMVILVVFAVFLFSIMAVSATPNPSILFGV